MATPANRKRPPTLQHVAERAGVTAATVSYVLNGLAESKRISGACVARVMKAAEELGYRGNYLASALKRGSSRTIGIGVGSGPINVIEQDFFRSMVAGVEHVTRQRGYDLIFVGSANRDDPWDMARHHLETRRIEGLIAIGNFYHLPLNGISAGDWPMVAVEGRRPVGIPRVALDAGPGIAAAIAHLAELGHRRIAWLAIREADGKWAMPERHAAACAAAAERGIEIVEIPLRRESDVGGVNLEARVRSVRSALGGVTIPAGVTAVLCMNDLVAMVLINLLRDRGLLVPRDLSVIGFDDLYGIYTQPLMTTISHRLRDIGETAATTVLELIDGASRPLDAVIPLEARLVLRESTGPVSRL